MIFENSSPKGIFGPNMSDSPNWSLTANSRSLQAAALKKVVTGFEKTVKKQSRDGKETAKIFLKRLHRDCKQFAERHVQ